MKTLDTQPTLPRRAVLRAAALAGLSTAVLWRPRGVAAQKSGRIVFATWGGSWEEAMRKAWFAPFTQKTGIEVVTISGPDYGKVRAMVQAGQTEWDVVEVNPDFQWIGARDGLLERLDFNVIDKSPILPDPKLVTDYSVPQVLWSRVMVYNTKQFTKDSHPKSWQEAWDLGRFPGKRALYNKPNGGSLEIALLADGVPADKLYPLDVDRALKSLDKIKRQVIWYDTNQQITQLMVSNQFAVGIAPDGRAMAAIGQAAPFAIEPNQSILTWSAFVVPKGAPNREGAMRLLSWVLTPEAQSAIAMAFPYGPVVPKAYDTIPAERAAILAGGPQQKGKYILADERWWAENLAAVAEKFTAWRIG